MGIAARTGTDESPDIDEAAAIARELAELRAEVRLLRMVNAELERVAVRDTLTPLYNRRYFLTALNERIVRHERYGARAAVLFADLDGLKYLNDTFGHGAGDFALVHMARLLGALIRGSDVAARIGGDEFALILEEADEKGARTKAAQLAAALADTPCFYGGAILPVGASVGLTVIRSGDSDEAVMARADAEMYATKRQRRLTG